MLIASTLAAFGSVAPLAHTSTEPTAPTVFASVTLNRNVAAGTPVGIAGAQLMGRPAAPTVNTPWVDPDGFGCPTRESKTRDGAANVTNVEDSFTHLLLMPVPLA